jgi:structural toxin protein (hemagglutinin/hemolysin) RtxA
MVTTTAMYTIFVYVPESHVEAVKAAMFAAGAGRIGNYSCCSWQVKGEGQFLPEAGSDPYVGEAGKVEQVSEYEVHVVCAADCVARVVAAMKAAHPYEMPAYGVVKLEDY